MATLEIPSDIAAMKVSFKEILYITLDSLIFHEKVMCVIKCVCNFQNFISNQQLTSATPVHVDQIANVVLSTTK